MKDVNTCFAECMAKLKEIGIEPLPIKEVIVNKRAVKRWGQAISHTGRSYFTISISEKLLADDLPDWPLEEVMFHEILHCVEGCHGHKGKWAMLARKVERKFGVSLPRCSDFSKLISAPEAKYVFECSRCGQKIERIRKSRFTQNPGAYRCRCGGKFHQIV